MPRTALLIAFTITLTACAGQDQPFRINCADALDTAWEELSFAEAEGFAGSVSYTKALGLMTTAKTMQTVENFDGCYENARKARFYIAESRQGR